MFVMGGVLSALLLERGIPSTFELICVGVLVLAPPIIFLLKSVVHQAERVRVMTSDGRISVADVKGASKLREGEWQRTKARLYASDGTPVWLQGDGFEDWSVFRVPGRDYFKLRPPQ
jgi:hypothetical protein